MADGGAPGPTGRAGRWAPGRWRVRTKVVAVILVPTLLALVLAGLVVGTQVGEGDALDRVAAGTRVTASVTELVDALQVERSEAAEFVATGRRGDRVALDATNQRVDRAVAALRDQGDTVAGLDPGVRDRYAAALVGLDAVGAVRTAVVGTRFPATAVVSAYGSLVQPLLEVSRDVAASAGRTAIVRPASSLAALGRAKEQLELQHALLLAGVGAPALPAGESDDLRSAVAEQSAAVAEFEAGATPSQNQDFDDTVAGPEIDQRVRILDTTLLRDRANQPLGIDPVTTDRAAGATRDAYRAVETRLQDDLQQTADGLAARAGVVTLAVVVGVVLAVLAAVLLALVVARSLITPLRRLRYSALDIAEQRLPASIRRLDESGTGGDGEGDGAIEVDPVPIHTEEEVGDVARAFDTVHREAVRLAAEQARMRTNLNALFVNLSRRSQGLVERQLLLIDTLERREEDPDVLADLFALDHLATRMRRNGENLLVLGGSGPSRGTPAPLPLADLLRAASGEVEDYRRVRVLDVPDVQLRGGPADDLIHLLAELLENATSFSPPGSPVVVSASRTPDGGLIVEVVDRGLGMDSEDLAAANARLERPVLLDASVPRQMGLFVVGVLARRHDVVARLLPGAGGGTTASVQIPAVLLVAPAPTVATTGPVPVAPPVAPPPAPTGGGSLFTSENGPADGDGAADGDVAGGDGAELPRRRSSAGATIVPREPVGLEEPPVDHDPTLGIPIVADAGPSAPTELIYREMCSAWFLEQPPDAAVQPAGPVGPAAPEADARGGDGSAWRSGGDQGWEAVATRDPAGDGLTGTGLPRRRRGAALVPGAAGAALFSGSDPQPRPPVDAEQLRSRLHGFQSGLRRARQEVDGAPVARDGHAAASDGEDLDGAAAGSAGPGPGRQA